MQWSEFCITISLRLSTEWYASYTGYYCPVGSISARQLACGNHDVYCPEGSRAPVPVLTGYYTVGGRNDRIPASSRMECRLNSVHLPEDLYGPLDIAFNSSRYDECHGCTLI